MSFESMKSNRKSQLDKLTSEINKLNSPTNNNSADDRFWKLEMDKAGNGYAIIRFLPAPSGEDVPFVRIWDHGFQGSGGWYIEKSLTTFNQPDPCTEYNSQLWNSGIEANKEIVRKQKRRLSYYSNIYVVSDPAHPENEGKVFLFKYGKKIFEHINEAMHPQFGDETPINPFDLWEGANFKLKIRKVDGYPNYDKSEFESPHPLSEDDDQLKKIYDSEYSLKELIDPKNFKSYDELKVRLEKALGIAGKPAIKSDEEYAPAPSQKTAAAKESASTAAPWDNANSDDDEDLSFFKKLVKE
jgi:hypothetical protein